MAKKKKAKKGNVVAFPAYNKRATMPPQHVFIRFEFVDTGYDDELDIETFQVNWECLTERVGDDLIAACAYQMLLGLIHENEEVNEVYGQYVKQVGEDELYND